MNDETFHHVLPGLRVWKRYSPEVKTDLWSTAVSTESGWWLFDPIPFPSGEDFPLVAGVILTNENHERDARRWLESDVPVFAPWRLFEEEVLALEELPAEFRVIPLPGGAPSESAFLVASICIIGDAVINMPPKYPLMFLPEKYCEDPPLLRESIRTLSKQRFEVLCMAHGEPVSSGGALRLRELLNT